MARYDVSPALDFRYPWINKADTEYNKDGLFHVDGVGRLADQEIIDLKASLDDAVDRAFADLTKDMKPGELKKWSKLYPYEMDEDDEGNETGYIVFKFKQNRTIKLKDGSTKTIKIGIRDSDDKLVSAQVFNGTIGRIMYSMRPIKVASSFKIGIRLDFAQVQIIELAQGSGGGFGKVEGGFKGEAPSSTSSEGGDESEESMGDY